MVHEKILRLVHLLLLSLAFILYSCSGRVQSGLDDLDAMSDIDTTESNVQMDTAKSVVIEISKNGTLNTLIKSSLMVRKLVDNNPSQVNMYGGVHIDFFNAQHDTVNQVDAKNGFFDEQSKYVILRDSVIIRNIEGEVMYTDYITWADSTHEFYTNDKVEIHTPSQTITGVGLVAAEDFSHYTIHQVKGVIQVDDSQLPSN